MKNLLLLLLISLTGNLTFANCPSVDESIELAKKGQATQVDVLAAMACNSPSCDIKIAHAEAHLLYMTELFELGEKTKLDISDAAIKFVDIKKICSK